MQKNEIWAISTDRIREFFRVQADVTEMEGVFCFHSCRITLTQMLSAQNSIFYVPRTQVRMEGEEKDVLEIHRRFFLRFLSAGG